MNTTSPRLFVPSPLSLGAEIPASAAQAHYLGTVLRQGPGDPVRLFNGVDGEWLAHAAFPRRDRAVLTVTRRTRPQTPESGPWLVFALLKRDATDLVVRQAVELGAARIMPVLTGRTNAARVNEDRLRAIAIEAAEQSERLTVPPVDPPARLDAVLAAWPVERRLFAALERLEADTAGPRPLHRPPPARPDDAAGSRVKAAGGDSEQAAPEDADPEQAGLGRVAGPAPAGARPPLALLVGPEGGFTPAEREMLRRMPWVTPLSLGPLVLRAETAAAAGQALLPGMGWAEYGGST